MVIKTSLNLKLSQSALLYAVASRFDVSLSFVINSLARKIFKSHDFSVRFFQSVQYQERLCDDFDGWDPVPVSFAGDVYEKCQDMRKMFKVSVSLVFASAINKYLVEFVHELEGVKKSDNYTSNYIMFFTSYNDFSHITLLWNIVDPERLKKIQNLHKET